MDGVFPYIKARSVPRQAKPYPNLVDAVKNQTTFEFHNVSGTVVGFWSPDLAKGINVAGYHLHFINAERNAGGHVLDLRLNGTQARIDMTPNISMALPTSGSFFNSNLTGGTQSDIGAVEK